LCGSSEEVRKTQAVFHSSPKVFASLQNFWERNDSSNAERTVLYRIGSGSLSIGGAELEEAYLDQRLSSRGFPFLPKTLRGVAKKVRPRRQDTGTLFPNKTPNEIEMRLTHPRGVAGVVSDLFLAHEQLLKFEIAANRIPHRIDL